MLCAAQDVRPHHVHNTALAWWQCCSWCSRHCCSPSFPAVPLTLLLPLPLPSPPPQLAEAQQEVKRLNKLMAALDAAGRGDTSAFLADDPGEAGGAAGCWFCLLAASCWPGWLLLTCALGHVPCVADVARQPLCGRHWVSACCVALLMPAALVHQLPGFCSTATQPPMYHFSSRPRSYSSLGV
jgi:hypothetical protein